MDRDASRREVGITCSPVSVGKSTPLYFAPGAFPLEIGKSPGNKVVPLFSSPFRLTGYKAKRTPTLTD